MSITPNNPDETWGLAGSPADQDDPLLECLFYLAKLHDRPTTRAALKAGLPLTDNYMTVDLFIRAAARVDLSAKVVKRKLAEMTDFELPAVLLLRDARACIATSISEVRHARPSTQEPNRNTLAL